MVRNIESEALAVKHELPEEHRSKFHQIFITLAKYAAVIAVGTGAGLYAARHGSRYHEFAADRFAASIVGKETMIDTLRQICKATGHSISETHHAEKFKGIIAETMLAHPSFAERAAHIRSK